MSTHAPSAKPGKTKKSSLFPHYNDDAAHAFYAASLVIPAPSVTSNETMVDISSLAHSTAGDVQTYTPATHAEPEKGHRI